MKKVYIITALLSLLMVSCSTDDVTDTGDSSLHTVSLNALIPNANKTRVVETADATTGLVTSWDSSDKLSVLLNTGNMIEMSKDETANGFTATVSETDQSAFTSGSIIYGVNNNSSDQITTSLVDGKINTIVDFTGQNGSLDNISKYDLMYGKGDVSKSITFNHKVCVMRFDLSSSQLSGNITSAAFSFVPSATSTSLFADKETYNLGATSDSTLVNTNYYALTNPSIAVVNNKASIYLVIPMRKAVSGMLNLTLTCTDGSLIKDLTLSKSITITNKDFNPSTVQAKAISSLASPPQAGDCVFSDGTWGSLADNPSKAALGVFFSPRVSDAEKAAGFIHGYVMALNDASPSAVWSTSETDLSYLDNNTTSNLWYGDMSSGYIGTANHGMGTDAAYPAWEAAYNYKSVADISNFANSGWYLPTAGQWFDILERFGGDEAMNTALVPYKTDQSYYLSVSSSSAMTNLDKMFTDAGGSGFTPYYYYWSSTENNGGGAIMFYTGQDVFNLYNTGKNSPHVVRAVFSF